MKRIGRAVWPWLVREEFERRREHLKHNASQREVFFVRVECKSPVANTMMVGRLNEKFVNTHVRCFSGTRV